MKEIFEWVPGFEGKYKVSNMGNVVSLSSGEPKPIYQTKNNCGYMQVKLRENKRDRHMYVHRLVAMVFVPGYKDGMEVNHKDMDRSNNTYTNLEWVTKSQNHKHRCASSESVFVPGLGRVKSGSRNLPKCTICEKEISYGATYCLECLKQIRRSEWPTQGQLAQDILTLNFCEIGRKYGCSDNNIRRICKTYGLPARSSEVNTYRYGSVAQR